MKSVFSFFSTAIFMTPRAKMAALVLAVMLYIIAFFPLYWFIFRGAIALSFLPVLVTALLYGRWIGAAMGAAFIPLNIILFVSAGDQTPFEFLGRNFWPAHAALIAGGFTAGYLQEVKAQLQTELRQRQAMEQERERLIKDMQKALDDVRILSGLLPICSHCKKIRNQDGLWDNVETYLHKHSDTEFTHSICPECTKEYYSDILKKV